MKNAFEFLKSQLSNTRQKTRRFFAAAMIVMLVTTPLIFQTHAQADNVAPQSIGYLDLSFGNGGKIMGQLKATANGASQASAIALQNDGKLVITGSVYELSGTHSVPDSVDFSLARYREDGSLDMNFGASGQIIDFFGFGDGAQAVVVQTDGKIIAAGGIRKNQDAASGDFGLARYNADGSPDLSFGNNGKVTTGRG